MTTYRLRVATGDAAYDILADAGEASTVGQLLDAVGQIGVRGHGVPRLDGAVVSEQASLRQSGLVHGAVLDLAGRDVDRAVRQPGRYVVAVSGPEAGRWWALPPGGRLDVGRDPTASIHIDDGLVSGHHLGIEDLGAAGVRVTDLGSSNGSFLEGELLSQPATLAPGAYVQVGSTVLTALDVASSDLPVEAAPTDGARPFQRHFRAALAPLPERLEPPKPPDEDRGSIGRSWWQYLLPLASGAGMAAITGRWQFLLIMAIAPIAMLVQYLRRQKADEAEREAELSAHETAAAEHRAEVARVRAVEQHRRRRTAVVGGEAVLMAELRHRRLWERSDGDDDFAEVTVGLASQPSGVESSAERGVTEDLWAVPLNVPLATTGSLLVSGDARRARGVGRSMLLNLAATHSPLELRLEVFTGADQSRDWNWVRWLPHAFGPGGTAAIHATPDQRDAATTRLVQQIETREESGASRPAVVVLIDGAASVPAGRLTALLRRGAEVGIHGVVLDDRIVPEGVRGTLELGGQPDEGVFTSSEMARVDQILTAELAPMWAERAARALAGLRPASDEAGGATAAEIHLTDLVADGRVDVAGVHQRWSRSPVEQVVVGLAGRTAVSMDIVRHGPHAIVGGATRSGKTEFLLTWLTSLCLHNSVDDLAILVADFKGGVDHVQTAKLPHVVSLVTNQDIRAFERTLVMLEAEIERRQDVLATAGASNIEAYRTARLRDDSRVPVPRLLVVVDEFSELRQADRESGAGYMSRLESVARVGAGLGVHLVLVTQNFAGGQLSDQIDGQVGLGVCFRVEKGEHSKVVLRSPVAATVPANRPGRAWARLRGQDLVEFQAARVAGRRRDLASDVEALSVEVVPFETVASTSVAVGVSNVPHDETDLALLIDVIADAAGGRTPPMPWPDELPVDLQLATVVGTARSDGGTVIGWEDVPERQQRADAMLGDADEQVLVVGSSERRRLEVLTTIGVADCLASEPTERHLYGIDLEGTGLSPLSSMPHTGAVACLDDDLALRIADRLGREAGRRRALFETEGVATLEEYERVAGRLPRIRVLVNGADRLAASSEGDASPLLRPLSSLAADSTGTGIQLVLAGGPGLVGRKIAQRASRRFVTELHDPGAYAVVGGRKDRAVDLVPPRRVWDGTRGRLVQLGAGSGDEAPGAEVVELVGRRLSERFGDDAGPQPMPEVRWPLPWARIDGATLVVPQGYGHAVAVGVETDTARWVWVDAEEDGPVMAVVGPARSGRSDTLRMLGRMALDLGWDVRAVGPTRRSGLWALADDGVEVVADPTGLVPAGSRRTLYLVDDVHRIEDGEGLRKVIDDSSAPIVVVLAGPVDVLSKRQGGLRGIPDARTALYLAPTSTTGLTATTRIPDSHRADPRPGRGVLHLAGEFVGIQLPAAP